jgi:hypothetical protein
MPTDRRRARPRLAVLATGLAAGLLVAACGGGGNHDAGTTTTLSPSARSAKATDVAEKAMTLALPTSDVRSYVLDLCTAATTQDRTEIDDDLGRLPIASDADLRSTITALGKGAQIQCPEGVRTSPNLLNLVYADVAATASTTSSTSTTTSTSTTEATSTTKASGSAAAATTSTLIDAKDMSPGRISGFH